jgi:bilirubin oxidase
VPPTLRPITALPAGPVLNKIEFSETLASGEMTFLINGKSYDMTRVDWTEKVDVVAEWDVSNVGNMDHPFHAHGGQFQVVSRTKGGTTVAEPFLAWRDMAIVTSTEVVRIRMKLETPGPRIVHCHILEHENQGMMATFNVNA